MAQHHGQRGCPRHLLWLGKTSRRLNKPSNTCTLLTPLSAGSDLHRLLLPRRRQIRRLRSLQVLLRREALPQHPPNNRLPRRLSNRRIHRRHLPVSLRSHQSPHADHPAALRQQPPRGLEQDCRARRLRRTVQGLVPSVGAPDPLHHGQVRDFRECGWPDLQAARQAKGGIQHSAADWCLFPRRLHRRYRLRNHLTPGRCYGVKTERRSQARRERRQSYGQNLPEHRLQGIVERTSCPVSGYLCPVLIVLPDCSERRRWSEVWTCALTNRFSQYRNDRHSYRFPMAYLRLVQGLSRRKSLYT